MRILKHLSGKSEYVPWWDEALNTCEDAWDWARGRLGLGSTPPVASDPALDRLHIEALADLARRDRG